MLVGPLPVLTITGVPEFDIFFSLTYWVGFVGWSIGMMIGLAAKG